jgi:putative ABC transport system substrate-binding protein
MRRREFITLVGGAAAWPAVAHAQQAIPVIGFLLPTSAAAGETRVRAFRQGLKDAGFADGENVTIEYRWTENRADRLPALAADLVRRQVAVIVTGGMAHWWSRRRRGQFPLCSSSAMTRSGLAMSRAWPGLAVT